MINTHARMMRIAGSHRSNWRRNRMQAMLDRMQLPAQARIIDLGGTEENWRLIDHDFHITLVNLPGYHPYLSPPPGHQSAPL